MRPQFYVTELKPDSANFNQMVQDNFRTLEDYLKKEPFLNGEFNHYELSFDAAVTNQKFQHRLTFVPKDIIQTFLTEGITLTWKYNSFDASTIEFSTNGACTVRFFVGRYRKEVGAR